LTTHVKTQLLCTQTTEKILEKTVKKILFRFNSVLDNKEITVIKDKNSDDIYCIYNIYKEDDPSKRIQYLPNTILIQRKRGTNTFYTINALNRLIWLLNDGKPNPKYRVNWDNYSDKFLLLKNNDLHKINIVIQKVYSKKTKENYLDNVKKVFI